jgi:hypothetical protein
MATSIREGMDQGGVAHEIIALVQERSKLDLSMFEAADKDGSGSIDFEEFAKMSCHVGTGIADSLLLLAVPTWHHDDDLAVASS